MNIIRHNTDYALRALVNLARHYGREAVSTKLLAQQEDISYQFACKIMQGLRQAKLVDSSMGPKGGFFLAKAPAKISVWNVIEAIQGPISLNKCLGLEGCDRRQSCPVIAKLAELQKHMESFLSDITLDDLLKSLPGSKRKQP